MLRKAISDMSLYNELGRFYVKLSQIAGLSEAEKSYISMIKRRLVSISSTVEEERLNKAPEVMQLTNDRINQLQIDFHDLKDKLETPAAKKLLEGEEYKSLATNFKVINQKFIERRVQDAVVKSAPNLSSSIEANNISSLIQQTQDEMGTLIVETEADQNNPKYLALNALLQLLTKVFIQLNEDKKIAWDKIKKEFDEIQIPNHDKLFSDVKQFIENAGRVKVSRSYSGTFSSFNSIIIRDASTIRPLRYYLNEFKKRDNLTTLDQKNIENLTNELDKLESRFKKGPSLKEALISIIDLQVKINDMEFSQPEFKAKMESTVESLKKIFETSISPAQTKAPGLKK